MTTSPLESSKKIIQAYGITGLQAWYSSLLILCFFFGGVFFAGTTLMRSQSVQSITWCMMHYVPCYGAVMLSLGSLLCPVEKSKRQLQVLVLLLVGFCPFLSWAYSMDSNTYMTLCSWGFLLVLLGIVNRIYKAMHELGSFFESSSIKKGFQFSYGCFQLGMVAPVYAFVGVSLVFWINHVMSSTPIPMPNIYSMATVAGNLGIGKWLFLMELFILLQLTVLTGWLCFLVHHESRFITSLQIQTFTTAAQSGMGDIPEPAMQPSEAPESVEASPNERI